MILSGESISMAVEAKELFIEGFNKQQLNPNSYNLTLHNELLSYKRETLDMKQKQETQRWEIQDTGLLLVPGRLYLGRTCEWTETPNHVPMIEGRSSLGRLGIFIHVTAGFGDIGYKGFWTLEIAVIQPTIIYPWIECCQIFYHTIDGLPNMTYQGKYQNARDIQGSMVWKDFESEQP